MQSVNGRFYSTVSYVEFEGMYSEQLYKDKNSCLNSQFMRFFDYSRFKNEIVDNFENYIEEKDV